MSYTMYTPLNVWLDPASVTDVVAYIQTYLRDNPIYSEEEIEEQIHDYLIAHPELIGGVQSVNGKTGTVVLSASDINTQNNVTIESVLSSLSSQISDIVNEIVTLNNEVKNIITCQSNNVNSTQGGVYFDSDVKTGDILRFSAVGYTGDYFSEAQLIAFDSNNNPTVLKTIRSVPSDTFWLIAPSDYVKMRIFMKVSTAETATLTCRYGIVNLNTLENDVAYILHDYLTLNDKNNIIDGIKTGKYINTKIVAPRNTTFIAFDDKGKNLVDANNVILGSYYNSSGVLVESADTFHSQLITVDAGASYGFLNARSKTWLTWDQQIISSSGMNDQSTLVTAPNNAVYLIVSSYTRFLNTITVLKTETAPQSSVEYDGIYRLDDIYVPSELIEFGDLLNQIISTNRFNKNDVTNGKAINGTTGEIVDNSSYSVSGFCPIDGGSFYYIGSNNRNWYDKNKTLLLVEKYDVGTCSKAPDNAAFVRFSFQTSLLDNVRIIKVESIDSPQPSYSPFSEFYQSPVQSESVLKGKKIGFLGDSYTSERNQLSYPHFIKSRTNIVSYNYGAAGSRICTEGTFVYDGVTETVDSFIVRAPEMDNDLDMVVIFGGINDSGLSSSAQPIGTIEDTPAPDSTFFAGYKYLLDLIVAKYPTAKIVTICPPQIPGYTRLHEEFVPAIKAVSAKYAIPCLDLDAVFSYSSVDASRYTTGSRYLLNNAGTASNVNIHLNQSGRLKLSWTIQRFIESQFVRNEDFY